MALSRDAVWGNQRRGQSERSERCHRVVKRGGHEFTYALHVHAKSVLVFSEDKRESTRLFEQRIVQENHKSD